MKLVVPEQCIALLKEHRTCYKDHANEYSIELNSTLEGISPYLPNNAKNILDVGCGMAGISALLSIYYSHNVNLWLLDKQGVSPVINAGFNKTADQFSHYHDFELAKQLLEINGVPLTNINTCDIQSQSFPDIKYDIMISLLSWGFHYPIDTYTPNIIKNGGIIVADVRRGTGGIEKLTSYGNLTIVHKAQKYDRVVVEC